jgi:hypothetical protein
VSAGTNTVDICHFQEETDSWKLLSLPQPVVAAHLENHDDALPGGTTSQTGTLLDANCQPMTAMCPCFDASLIVETFAEVQMPVANTFCQLTPGPGLRIIGLVGITIDPSFVSHLNGPSPALCNAQCQACQPPFNVRVDEGSVVTEADILACESEICQAADRLGVPCP